LFISDPTPSPHRPPGSTAPFRRREDDQSGPAFDRSQFCNFGGGGINRAVVANPVQLMNNPGDCRADPGADARRYLPARAENLAGGMLARNRDRAGRSFRAVTVAFVNLGWASAARRAPIKVKIPKE
jgi:hypothetical protein